MQTIYQTTDSKTGTVYSLTGNTTGQIIRTGWEEAKLKPDLHAAILEALQDTWTDKVYARQHKGKKSYFKLTLAGEEKYIA